MVITKQSNLSALVGLSLSVTLLSACSGGGSDPAPAPGTRSGASYLYVSPVDYYFGTKNVGSTTTAMIRIANRGADVYELTSMQITGSLSDDDLDDYHPEEFATDLIDNIELQPAETVSIGVSFKPITEQQKKANFVVNYDTKKIGTEEANANEQRYYQGLDLEKNGDYPAARKTYSAYVNGESDTSNKRRAAIKIPIITESDIYGTGKDLELYLTAIDQRDVGDLEAALGTLQSLGDQFSDSYLADDAIYLSGYIQLMDQKDLPAALRSMQALRKQYPDSTYYDTSLYSEAIAQLELGNDVLAREMLTELRNRHKGLNAFGLLFAKDNLISRLWFDRTGEVLQRLNAA